MRKYYNATICDNSGIEEGIYTNSLQLAKDYIDMKMSTLSERDRQNYRNNIELIGYESEFRNYLNIIYQDKSLTDDVVKFIEINGTTEDFVNWI